MDLYYETLDTYTLLAKKVISKFSSSFYSGLRNELLNNEEAISEIAEALMIADWRWDADRKGHNGQSKTRYSYRNQCGLWAMKTYVSKKYKKKNRQISIDHAAGEDKSYLHNVPDYNSDPSEIVSEKEEKDLLQKNIYDLLNSDILTSKQKDQIHQYYFEDKTLLEIGKQYGVTREAIRQNIQKGLTSIRNYA
jgi:RNA polymerase sigma factor (sigma-70 family)